MTVAHPIAQAWLSTGGTGAQNYDEFADDAEITSIIAANPRSALAVEMPHKAPESLGQTFLDSLPAAAARPVEFRERPRGSRGKPSLAGPPAAAARLAEARADGSYTPAEQVVVLYRIT